MTSVRQRDDGSIDIGISVPQSAIWVTFTIENDPWWMRAEVEPYHIGGCY